MSQLRSDQRKDGNGSADVFLPLCVTTAQFGEPRSAAIDSNERGRYRIEDRNAYMPRALHAGYLPAGLTATALVLLVSCTSVDPAEEKADGIRRGDALIAEKKFDQAAIQYGRALRHDARDGRLRMKLAEAYVLANEWQRASNEAVRAADLLPDDREVQLRAAELMLSQQRFVDVESRMSAILAQEPGNARALLLKANATARLLNDTWAFYTLADAVRDPYKFSAGRGELRPGTAKSVDAAAEALYKEALRVEPGSMDAAIAYGNFLWATGRAQEAEPFLRRFADGNPGHANANHALGSFYLSVGRLADGERYLKNAASLADYGREARFALAEHYERSRRDTDAIALLASMLEDDDKPSRAVTVALARAEFRSGQRQQALARIDALLSKEPSHAGGQLLKAQFAVESREWERALPLARAALAQAPASSEAHATLGDVLFATGELESAYVSYGNAFRLNPGDNDLPVKLARLAVSLGRGAEGIQTARDARRRRPDDPTAAFALAQALALTGDPAAAEDELRPLVEGGAASAPVQALLGTVRMERGNKVGARAAFDRALQLDPRSIEAIAGLVQLDLKERSFKTARQRIEKALLAAPDDVRLLLLSADAAAAVGDLTEAEKTLRHATQIDKNSFEPVIALSELLAQQRRGEDAREVLSRFLQHHPTSSDAQTRLAMLLEDDGKLEEARRHYEQIVGRDRRAPLAASRLAALHVELKGNLDVALDLAILAKQQLPKDPGVADTLGWVYVAKNVTGLALPHLRDAVRTAPDNPLYRFHLGRAYLQAGDRLKAREELKKALTLDGSFRHADAARQLLSSLG